MHELRPGAVLRALWLDLPLVNYAVYAVGIAWAEVVNLDPPRPELFWTFVFPLAVPLLVYALRWPKAAPVERLAAALLVGLVALVLLVTGTLATPQPIAATTLRRIYEASAILNTVLLGVHAWRRHRAWLGLFFGPAAAYGLLLENGGILLGYFSELDYALYLGPLPAPLATMSGWITVFYLVTWVTWELRARLPWLERSAVGSALVAMLAALALDLQIDPLATAVGFWTWHPALTPGFLGVPWLNFAAWGAAVFPFALLLFWRQTRLQLTPEAIADGPHLAWLWLRVPLVLGLAALLFTATMLILEGGFGGPTYLILYTTLARWGLISPDVIWTPGG